MNMAYPHLCDSGLIASRFVDKQNCVGEVHRRFNGPAERIAMVSILHTEAG